MPDVSGSVDLGSLPKEAQEHLEKMAEDNPPDPDAQPSPERPKVFSAFSVIVDLEGKVSVLEFDDPNIDVQTELNPDILAGAVAVIQKDMIAQETAQHTVQLQMLQAQRMQQQFEGQQLAKDLGNLRHG